MLDNFALLSGMIPSSF